MSIGTINLITNTSGFENRFFLNNPDITFFKSVYRKHTNFCKYLDKSITQNLQLSDDLKSITEKIKGADDLLSKIYLENKLKLTKKNGVTLPQTGITIFANLGSNIITSDDDDSLSIDIGSNRSIFKSFGLFQEVKGELSNQMSLTSNSNNTQAPHLDTETSGNTITISCKNGSHYNYTTLSGGVRGIDIPINDLTNIELIETEYFYTIPEFSFMKDYGLALPLLALRNDDIIFNVKFNSINNICKYNNNEESIISKYETTLEYCIIKELIHLDIDEKRRFLTSQLTYLTEHINKSPINNTVQDVSSPFKLCKYVLLVGNPDINNFGVSKSSTTPNKLKFNTLNIKISGNPLYSGSSNLNKEVFTKININKYFPGCGRNLTTNLTKGVFGSSTSSGTNITLDDLNNEIVQNMIITGGGINVQNITVSEAPTTDSRSTSLTTSESINSFGLGSDNVLTFSLNEDFGQLDSIAMIPFAIDPLNYTQPSGCISNNDSNNKIVLETNTDNNVNPDMVLYAVNYNILQISNGKAQVYTS